METQPTLPEDPFGRAPHQYRRGDRMRVLGIHETALLRQVVARSLRQFDGIDDVVTVATVEEAITELQQAHFDLVISDWNLATSSMTGMDLLRALRSGGWSIPIGLIAAEVDDDRHRRALDAGADFLLRKPFSPDSLAKAIGLPEAGDWVDSGPRQRLGSGALDEQLAEVLSKLCDTSVAVTPSPSGANSHVHRLVASYVDDEGNPLAFAVFEIRLAAALSGAMARFAPAVAEGSVTTGVLPEPLSDALAELADVLTPFVNRSGLQPHFQQLVAYAPGEPLPSEPGRALEVKSFHGAVTRYDAGGFSIVTAKPIAE